MDLSALTPAAIRELLPRFLAAQIGPADAADASAARVGDFVNSLDDSDLVAWVTHLGTLGEDSRIYFADPTARRLSRTWSRDVVNPATVAGAEVLRAAASGPTLVVANHLSYIDSTAIDATLSWAGHVDLADRIVAIAGPKVYSDLFRRIAAGCLNTLPTAQSTRLEGTERLSPRELARRAQAALSQAHAAMDEGQIILLYAEGSRSRNGVLQPFLKATWRYLAHPNATIVPLSIEGTDQVYPVDAPSLAPAPVHLHFGSPIARSGDPHADLRAIHAAVAAGLSARRRPEDGAPRVA